MQFSRYAHPGVPRTRRAGLRAGPPCHPPAELAPGVGQHEGPTRGSRSFKAEQRADRRLCPRGHEPHNMIWDPPGGRRSNQVVDVVLGAVGAPRPPKDRERSTTPEGAGAPAVVGATAP
jgi:hypothetical protein